MLIYILSQQSDFVLQISVSAFTIPTASYRHVNLNFCFAKLIFLDIVLFKNNNFENNYLNGKIICHLTIPQESLILPYQITKQRE